jgi:hypothetical protein
MQPRFTLLSYVLPHHHGVLNVERNIALMYHELKRITQKNRRKEKRRGEERRGEERREEEREEKRGEEKREERRGEESREERSRGVEKR